MDWDLLAIVSLVSLVVLVIGARITGAWDRQARARADQELELARLKSGWYQQMQRAKAEKKPKKKRDEEDEEEEDEGDDLDVLVDALRPYQPFVKGLVQSKGWPVDVDKLFAGDAVEHDKVGSYIEMQLKKMPAPGAGGQLQSGEKDWWANP